MSNHRAVRVLVYETDDIKWLAETLRRSVDVLAIGNSTITEVYRSPIPEPSAVHGDPSFNEHCGLCQAGRHACDGCGAPTTHKGVARSGHDAGCPGLEHAHEWGDWLQVTPGGNARVRQCLADNCQEVEER